MNTPIPAKWSKWIFASCARHFYDRRAGIYLHVEGQKRRTEDLQEWLEFRLDGPYFDEQTRGNFRVDVEINVACMVVQDKKAYRIHEVSGIAQAAFTYGIELRKLGDAGDDPENTGELFGCLTLLPKDKERVVSSFFGKVQTDSDLYQSTVEGHYRAFISI